jgi:hypothetical protein
MSIEQVAWSDDDSMVAVSSLSGRMSLKRITKTGQKRDAWSARHEFEVLIPPSKRNISQLIFHPAGRVLFALTSLAICSINIKSQAVTESLLLPSVTKLKWICHPALPQYLLGFGVSMIYVHACDNLRSIKTLTHHPPRITEDAFDPADTQQNRCFKRETETLGRIIASAESPHVLVVIHKMAASGRLETQHLVFKVADIDLDKSGSETMRYAILPEDSSARIQEPLAFISRGRLLFPDVERWVCSWSLAPSSRMQMAKSPDSANIEQYYFLPSDWATGNEASLCSVMPDGTLLCPRNGEVAAVQSSKLRR